jgi:hypothetical protein
LARVPVKVTQGAEASKDMLYGPCHAQESNLETRMRAEHFCPILPIHFFYWFALDNPRFKHQINKNLA